MAKINLKCKVLVSLKHCATLHFKLIRWGSGGAAPETFNLFLTAVGDAIDRLKGDCNKNKYHAKKNKITGADACFFFARMGLLGAKLCPCT